MENSALSGTQDRRKNQLNGKDISKKGKLHRQSSVSDGEATINIKGLDAMENGDVDEEKSLLIEQVLGLQSTLDDLSQRVDAVKDENLKLKSENQVLGQYIENLMSASNVFQATGDNKGQKGPTRSSKKH